LRDTKELHDAIEADNLLLIERLVATAEINMTVADDFTALHMVADLQRKRACELILQSGRKIFIDCATMMQRTPLHLAAMRGNLDIVQMLVQCGARTDIVDLDKESVCHFAARSDDDALLRYLIHLNCDFFLTNEDDETAYALIQSEQI
jgi:ankyrin repeat protein